MPASLSSFCSSSSWRRSWASCCAASSLLLPLLLLSTSLRLPPLSILYATQQALTADDCKQLPTSGSVILLADAQHPVHHTANTADDCEQLLTSGNGETRMTLPAGSSGSTTAYSRYHSQLMTVQLTGNSWWWQQSDGTACTSCTSHRYTSDS